MVRTFVSALLTMFVVGIVGASIPVAIASLLSYIASQFLVGEAFEKVKEKEMPDWIEWTAYGAAFIGTVLMAAGLRYLSVGVLIASGIVYVIAVIAYQIHKYMEAK